MVSVSRLLAQPATARRREDHAASNDKASHPFGYSLAALARGTVGNSRPAQVRTYLQHCVGARRDGICTSSLLRPGQVPLSEKLHDFLWSARLHLSKSGNRWSLSQSSPSRSMCSVLLCTSVHAVTGLGQPLYRPSDDRPSSSYRLYFSTSSYLLYIVYCVIIHVHSPTL